MNLDGARAMGSGDNDERKLRRLHCVLGALRQSDGSARLSYVSKENVVTECLVSVYGPLSIPTRREKIERAVVTTSFTPMVGLRGFENSEHDRFVQSSIETVICSGLHPRTEISAHVQVLNDDGSLLSCAINGAVLALLDAAVPLSGLIGSVDVILSDEEGGKNVIVVDPCLAEERASRRHATFVFRDEAVSSAGSGLPSLVSCLVSGAFSGDELTACRAQAAAVVPQIFAFFRSVLEARTGKTVDRSLETAPVTDLSLKTEETVSFEDLRRKFMNLGQNHVFRFYEELSEEDRSALVSQLHAVDLGRIQNYIEEKRKVRKKKSKKGASTNVETKPLIPMGANGRLGETIYPLSSWRCARMTANGDDQSSEWMDIGLGAISRGEVAAIITAGGQGTRLGFHLPKGLYDISLPSKKSLFQLQFERARHLVDLAQSRSSTAVSLPLFILTSDATHDETEKYLRSVDFFGYNRDDVFLMRQGWLPCLSSDGTRLLMEEAYSLARAPDGNGGVYRALLQPLPSRDGVAGTMTALDVMQKRGVKFVHLGFIDNALGCPGDPCVIGYVQKSGAKCVGVVLPRASPQERVGMLCEREDPSNLQRVVTVVEYSELGEKERSASDGDGLLFWAGNIGVHCFSFRFLTECCNRFSRLMHLHEAQKPISVLTADKTRTSVKGVKLELFVFDVFPFAGQNFRVLETVRHEAFAPVKNAAGSGNDCPETAVGLISEFHRALVLKNGGTIDGDGIVEISPLLSWRGENLADRVAGKTFQTPCYIE